MKAAIVTKYGSVADVALQEVDVPKFGPADVLVHVEAANVNPLDVKLISGQMQGFFPFSTPYIAGTDFSGTIVDVGASATQWKKGDRVFGRLEPAPGDGTQFSRTGALAEFVAVPAVYLAHVPEAVELANAAALPTAAGTAYQALFETADLKPGQTALIHGGAGGVGSFAIQLAKGAGARVITTTSQENAEFARSLGADEVIDYTGEDFASKVREVDLVLDTIGGEVQEKSFAVLRKGGHLVTTVSPPDEARAQSLGLKATFVFHLSNGARLTRIVDLCASKKLHIEVSHTYSLADVGSALAKVGSGHNRGKLLVSSRL
jgi:2-desacetyl-2-hydroxyethyl bacteriochlorophyllide A dehydrogenase